MSKNSILVTGAAGFIGYHLSQRLVNEGSSVIGIDNINDYYDPSLKTARLKRLEHQNRFDFELIDIADRAAVERLFAKIRPKLVIHLAAQAGVRYSLTNPHVYASSNLVGFLNILEGCRNTNVNHLVYASSSSVYGANEKTPFSVGDPVDQPVSLYAATKKSNELMAYAYSHAYSIPMTGLRFFTVYGPWGRPDMAYYSFAKKIIAGNCIEVYNFGNQRRDFTYIDDVIESVLRISKVIPGKEESRMNQAAHKIYNIGNSSPIHLLSFIEILGKELNITPKLKLMPMQLGDVKETFSDSRELEEAIRFRPQTTIEFGLRQFVKWYHEYHKS